jgi:hypothetical protein
LRKSILACLAVALIVGASSATAATLITGKQIKNGTITAEDIKRGSINGSRLSQGLRDRLSPVGSQGKPAVPGAKGDHGDKGDKGDHGDKGDKGDPGPRHSSGNWGIINRNTIGAPGVMLRSGPGEPPVGTGSLNLLVADGDEKIAFGNETDYMNRPLSEIDQLGLSVYNGFDPASAYVSPGVSFEVDPNVVAANYSSLVYVPPIAAAGERNHWLTHDLDAAAPTAQSGWFFTNSATAVATGCGQGAGQHFCSWDEVQAQAPDAVITFSVAITKGRDNAFTGAVDGLRINGTVFDFEEDGVRETRP